VRHAIEKSLFQSVTQVAYTFALFVQARQSEFRSFAHPGDGGDILGSRTAIPFRVAAVQQRPKLRSFSDVKRPYTLRPAKLVRGNRKQIHAQPLYINGDFPSGLHGIGMKQDAVFAANSSQLGNGLDGTNLIVGGHGTYEDGIGTQGLLEINGIYSAFLVYGQVSDPESFLLLQVFAAVEHGMMLDGRCDDVFAFVFFQASCAKDRKVGAFSSAAGKYDFAGFAFQDRGSAVARFIQQSTGLTADMMHA